MAEEIISPSIGVGGTESGAMEPEIADQVGAEPAAVMSQIAAPQLVVRSQGSSLTLQPDRDYVIGRDPASDIVIEEPLVSWRHAVLKVTGGRWVLDDAGS